MSDLGGRVKCKLVQERQRDRPHTRPGGADETNKEEQDTQKKTSCDVGTSQKRKPEGSYSQENGRRRLKQVKYKAKKKSWAELWAAKHENLIRGEEEKREFRKRSEEKLFAYQKTKGEGGGRRTKKMGLQIMGRGWSMGQKQEKIKIGLDSLVRKRQKTSRKSVMQKALLAGSHGGLSKKYRGCGGESLRDIRGKRGGDIGLWTHNLPALLMRLFYEGPHSMTLCRKGVVQRGKLLFRVRLRHVGQRTT